MLYIMNNKKKIVILGAGFAGVYSAISIWKKLGNNIEITIINQNNHFLFTPMLHEVATGGVGHHQVVESLREIFYKKEIKFFEGKVESVDLERKEVVTNNGNKSYDILVVAIGATTNFYNTKGAEENSFVLKDLSNAIKLRNHIITQFESASRETDKKIQEQKLSFVVVGGGATGVELSAEISDFCRKTFRKYYSDNLVCENFDITLINSGAELLRPFDIKTRKYAEKILQEKRVNVLQNKKVNEVTKTSVKLEGGEEIFADTIIWTAGVKPNEINFINGEVAKDEIGRIIANKNLLAKNYDNIFVLGDVANIEQENGNPYPMLAQVASEEAELIGTNIYNLINNKKLVEFNYKLNDQLVSLGQWEAAGTVMSVHIYGLLAWFIWRTVYLFKFISNSKKIKIAIDWTIHLFHSRDITKI